MKHNSKTVVSGTNLVALKHFERIADHSTNIAESVFL
jgi:phosphate transport system protein